jgi:hypothetical protein
MLMDARDLFLHYNAATKSHLSTNTMTHLPDIYMAVNVGVLTRTQMLPGLYVYVAMIGHPSIIIQPMMYQMRDGMGSTFVPNHTPRLMSLFWRTQIVPKSW